MPPTRLTRTLRQKLAQSPLLAFNQLLRDRWMTEQANQVPEGSRVLDVGAGSSPYRRLFAHCDYHTQDFAQLNAEQLRHGGYGPIDYVSDATAIPVPDAGFDLVLCTEMLEHVPEPIRVIRELARILKPGGRLLLSAPSVPVCISSPITSMAVTLPTGTGSFSPRPGSNRSWSRPTPASRGSLPRSRSALYGSPHLMPWRCRSYNGWPGRPCGCCWRPSSPSAYR